jgi:hypothetical protein
MLTKTMATINPNATQKSGIIAFIFGLSASR